MKSLQYDEYFFELVNDGVMTRTMEGIIEFWNRSAEKLYGWKKEEAIGRVSHELLQTRFPKPLEEIESELVRNGLWEGRLVHTTRGGDRVVVESRWALELKGQSGALVEINTRSADCEMHTDEITNERKHAANLLEETVSPLQSHEYFFELVNDSVMTRTMDGMINFWNRSAEKLYGWRKEEAIGRISHELLQTRFPKPLEEIESELVRNGRWEGRLVHTTRGGDHVVVESRWTLELKGQSGALVEINTRSADCGLDPEGRTGRTESRRQEPLRASKLMKANDLPKIAKVVLAGGAFLGIIAALIYALFGHDLIKAIYDGKFLGIDEWLMVGKATTRLENYYREADDRLVRSMLWLGASLLVALLYRPLIKRPVGALLAIVSFVGTTFLLFCVLEAFPALLKPLHLDVGGYYGYKEYYVPDEGLGWRRKPLTSFTVHNFRGGNYSPRYGIEVPPSTINWTNDENGFRNHSTTRFSDIVIMGDSFMEVGDTDLDTLPARLEKHMPGLTVTNLGSGGYGPFQYLEALKRYGLKKRPNYVLFAFYSGNDIGDIKDYSQWKRGARISGLYSVGELSFLERYWFMLSDFITRLKTTTETQAAVFFDKMGLTGGYEYIPPEVAILNMGHKSRDSVMFEDLNDPQLPNQMLSSNEWQELSRILSEFKEICLRNGAQLIAVYVPTATEIYAKYSTNQSGIGWLAIRDQQIAAAKNRETAFVQLSRELHIDLVNLGPVFEDAAQRGELLYHPLDSHWNANGRELAAATVAHAITSRSFFGSNDSLADPHDASGWRNQASTNADEPSRASLSD